MQYRGSCHCGRIAFEVDSEQKVDNVMECNCSYCGRVGQLLWFLPADRFRLTTPESDMALYMFNKHVIKHHFCPQCGCKPFGFGQDKAGNKTVAINARCLEDVDLSTLKRTAFDGRNKV
jgi:hypothetical protein